MKRSFSYEYDEHECSGYRRKDCTDVFAEKIEKIIYDFTNFLNKKIIFIEENYTKYWSEKTCYTCKGEFILGYKNFYEALKDLYIYYTVYTLKKITSFS